MTRESSAGNASEPRWFKSSHSGSNDNDCVEVATTPGAVHVRDSKATEGPRLGFAATAWSDFVAHTSRR